MRVILDDAEYKRIWNKIYDEYQFAPLYKDWSEREWIVLPGGSKRYSLHSCWTEDQERLVNQCFQDISSSEMYALDYDHDCFIFDPKEDIPFEYWYYDEERSCNVFFPSYYPNGDYHFFVTTDWRFGLFGHPWKQEIDVMGSELIEWFEKHRDDLDL